MVRFGNYSFDTGKKTNVMGILNITQDSFYDGGKYNSLDTALNHYLEMIDDGADIIDIGAQSTRPGHISITAEEELSIVKQYLPYLYNKMNFCISIDTFYPEVAKYALDNGASIINDVSGKFNPEMAKIVREYKCGWIITHTAESDSSHPVEYKEGVISAVNGFIDDMTDKLISASIDLDQIVFDPGIGFGKTCDDDLIILKEFDKLNHNRPLLLACSNKRVIGYLSCADINNRLYGTVAANVSSVLKGADFIRVHDVKANKLAVSLADVLRS